MRCATLGQALASRGHEVTALTDGANGLVIERYRSSGIELRQDSPFVRDPWRVLSALRPDLVVVDGYGLDLVAETVGESDSGLLIIDDNAELPVDRADIVLNQNLHADTVPYRRNAGTRWLLGPRYALLRADVLGLAREARSTTPSEIDVLVAMGGSDPARLTQPLAERVVGAHGGRVSIAIGDAHPDRWAIDRLIADRPDMAALADATLVSALRTADVAVIGGGTTLWEVAHLGIPAVVAIVADNQVDGSRMAADAGFARVVDTRGQNRARAAELLVGEFREVSSSPTKRHEMARSGRALFDGLGTERVVAAIEETT